MVCTIIYECVYIPCMALCVRLYECVHVSYMPLNIHVPDLPLCEQADIVDCATDALSGLTSQPSFGAVINALRGSAKDTLIEPRDLNPINDYWEETRRLYCANRTLIRPLHWDTHTTVDIEPPFKTVFNS